MIKLFAPYMTYEIISAVNEILLSGCLTQGPQAAKFEKEFEKKFNIQYAVSLNSGTSALETAYDLIGLKKGDEVITTPLTCTATNIPLLARSVKIVWADILEDTLCIDPQDVINKIKEGKTKAIVQVHLGGVQAILNANYLDDLCIPIISDACQALGIFTGDYTACSFQAIKHITTGDGGMLILNNEKDYKRAKLMRWFGIDRERKIHNDWTAYKQRMMSFDIEILGAKRHMNDIAATMGLAGLKNYDKILNYRKSLFDIYRHRLAVLDGIKLIDNKVNVYWLATVLVERRDDFARKLFEAGIETNMVQIRNDIYKIFGGKRAALPVMNSIEEKYLSLPIGMHVNEEDIHYICDKISEGW